MAALAVLLKAVAAQAERCVVVSTSTAALDAVERLVCRPQGCVVPMKGRMGSEGHGEGAPRRLALSKLRLPSPSLASVRIDGGTSVEARQDTVDRFNKLGLGQVGSGLVGCLVRCMVGWLLGWLLGWLV
jgi:hypothetical protein